ncbi:MAG: capsular biosynthesis protein, partial [Phyllobacteriaceae bacterium]|nr:capsular biosynthesis protein [Phyllobacteriaceae bacterium]
VPPLVEYAGWILKGLRRGRTRRRCEAVAPRFLDGDAPLFLFPLQLPGDYQILLHAPGGDLFALVAATIASFARHASAEARLLFKVHPLDNGLSRWPERIAAMAAERGIADRVGTVDGGALDAMIARASGVVTINSTVGTATLAAGKPLIALGNAIFDRPGLTHSGSLAEFWRAPEPPDPELVEAFFRLLVDRLQVRGGFVGRAAIEAGAVAVAERIVAPEEAFGMENRRARRQTFRRAAELFGETPASPA